MTPQRVQALYRISLLYDSRPEAVFQQILETITHIYGDTMAMLNLVDGDCLQFRAVVNVHPVFGKRTRLQTRASLCQFALKSMQPFLLQNAEEHPEFRRHAVVRLKLRRYLGVPVCTSAGVTVGTLCFLDDRTEELLGEEDIQFLSLLAMRVSAELEREQMIEARLAEQRAYTKQLQQKLDEQAVALQAAQETVLETAQMRAVGALAMGIAHDLRNILTTLRLELSAFDDTSYPSRACLQLDRLYALTHSLLALSAESHVDAVPVDLREVINFVFSLLQGQAEVDGAHLCKRVARGLPAVSGDLRRLEHLFVNLVVNALHAVAATGGTITVAIRREAGRVRVDVRDTGPGISPEHHPHLFEPFFTTRANRTGLGLFSARRIVEAHQGEIQVKSRPGKDTCVSVWLPVAPQTAF